MTTEAERPRRAFLAGVGSGCAALAVAGVLAPMGPAQARASGQLLRVLDAREGGTLEALGDVLLPGAAEAGIAHFVDDQLASRSPLLMLKYVDYPGTCVAFYRQGLGSLDRVARARHGVAFAALESGAKSALVGEIARRQPPGWQGPPSQLFYFILRGDAVDVVYGTQQGYARLEIPYMAHIAPRKAW